MLVSRASGTARGRIVVRAVAVFLGATLLGACQSNPEPPPLETASETASPYPSTNPSQTAPTMPAEAQGRSEAAAKAFVRHYIDTVNYAMRTGDTAELDEMSDPNCGSCSAVEKNISGLYSSGGYLKGDGWRLTAARTLQITDNSAVVQGRVKVTPQDRYEAASASPQRFDGGQQSMTFRLTWSRDRWLVRAWSQDS